MSETKKDTNLVRTAGRGVIYITLAKIWFMLTGWVLIFGLPRIFKWASDGDIEKGQILFGAYKIVVMGVSFINNGIITGTIQAVSKFTSEESTSAQAVRRTALKVQGLLGVALAILYIGFAVLIADLLGSGDLALLMRVTAGIIVAYSCYAVFIGSFNGQRLFSRQAFFDASYTTVKTALIIAFAAAGFEVMGTVVGFLVASVVIAIAAAAASGWGKDGGSFPARRYLSFASVLITYTFFVNLVMSLDLFLLKGIVSRMATAAGADPEKASDLGKALAGQYGAAQGLAFIPYQAILSVAFVAFPMISKATFDRDAEKTRSYVKKTMRLSAIAIVGFASVFAALPGQALGLIFPAEYRMASDALAVLSLGIAAFGLMVVSNTILNGAGFVWHAMAVVVSTLVAVVGAVFALVSGSSPGEEALLATAVGSSVGMALGLGFSAVSVYRKLGAFWPWATALRITIAAVIAIWIGRLLPDAGKLTTLVECAAVLGIYFALLILCREFGRDDLDQMKQVIRRRA